MAPRRICKVFLDSNVILSGLFSDQGAPRIILDLLAVGLPVLAGATGLYNLMEVERNLKKKMPEALPLYQEYLPKLGLEVVALPCRGNRKKYGGSSLPRRTSPCLPLRLHAAQSILLPVTRRTLPG